MGVVFRPKDFGRDNRKVVENAIKEYSPDTKENVIKLLNSWKGEKSASKLRQILGQNKSEEILRNITEDINLPEDEQIKCSEISNVRLNPRY
jgi:hypothetical protein